MIGGYVVCVVDASGRVTAEVERFSQCGRPHIGDEIEVEGKVYYVERVRYVEEDQRTVRVYTMPRLFVRTVRSHLARRA